MGRSVDSKIVEMRFDNKEFETNVKTSMSTLDKLNEKLNIFKGPTETVSSLNSEIEKTNFNPLTSAIGTVQNKFSTFEIMAITALANITNSAVNAGKQLIKSLTIDQVTAGWSKYGQKTASVQSIINATGKTIDEVNTYLNKLMWFSDETSYGFTDMTAALGQMTSAGGDIDKLIPLIEGVANATAYAGKGTNEFSRAMYNLNQSYSAGNLQYMDWKSLELAGIASKELKQAFIDEAKALGKLNKEGKTSRGTLVNIGNFGQTLQEKWADTTVMEAAFGRFSKMTEKAYEMVLSGEVDTASEAYEILSSKFDDVAVKAAKSAQEAKTFSEAIEATKDAVSSGFMKSSEIIFGNYEEAKVLWTDLANNLWDAFASGAEGRNKLLQSWKDLGGRNKLIESFWNVWRNISETIGSVKEAFRDIFPKTTAQHLYNATTILKEFTERLRPSDDQLDKLSRTFKGLFAAIDIVKMAITSITKAFFPSLIHGTGTVIDKILGYTSTIGDSIVTLREWIKSHELFTRVASGVSTAVTFVTGKIQYFVKLAKTKINYPVFEKLGGVLTKLKDKLRDFIEYFKFTGDSIEDSTFVKAMTSIWNVIKAIGGALFKIFGSALKSLITTIANADFSTITGFFNAIASGGFAVLMVKMSKAMDIFTNNIKESGGFIKNIKSIFGSLKGVLVEYQNKLKSETLMKIATAVTMLAASMLVLSMIDPERLGSAAAALATVFTELLVSMKTLNSPITKGADIGKFASGMIPLSIAVLMLSGAMTKLSSLDSNALIRSGVAVAFLMTVLGKSVSSISKDKTARITKGMTGLIAFALSIRILVGACKSISKMNWDEITKGLVGVGSLLSGVVLFLKFAKLDSKLFSTGLGIIALATGIRILSSSCKVFSSMSLAGLSKGLVGVGALLLEIIAFTKLGGGAKNVISTGLALIAISTGVLILSKAISKLGSMSLLGIVKGLYAMAGGLTAMIIPLHAMPKGSFIKSLGIMVMATSLNILANAIRSMSSLSWGEIAHGLVLLGGALLEISIGLVAMKDSLSGSAALLVASLAISVLSLSLRKIGKMDWTSIIKGLVMLAGTFTILGVAGLVLGPLSSSILTLAGAVALIGAGCLAAGIGIQALAIGFGLLAGSLSVGTTALIAAITEIVNGMLVLIPKVLTATIKSIGECIKIICQLIIDSASSLGQAVITVVLAIVEILNQVIEPVAECVFKILMTVLRVIDENAFEIVTRAVSILTSVLYGIAEKLPDFINSAVAVLESFVKGLTVNMFKIVQAGIDFVISLINGVADGLRNNSEKLVEAGWNLLSALAEGIVKAGFLIWEKIWECIKSALGFLKEKYKEFKEAGANIIEGFKDGLIEKFEKVKDKISKPFEWVSDKVREIFDINSPSKVFEKIGEYVDEGFVNGITNKLGDVVGSGENLANSFTDSFNDGLEDSKKTLSSTDLLESIDSNPTITPILDLSRIEEGGRHISDLFSNRQAIYAAAEKAIVKDKDAASVNVNMTIYGAEGQDVAQLAEIVAYKLNHSINVQKDVWGNNIERTVTAW